VAKTKKKEEYREFSGSNEEECLSNEYYSISEVERIDQANLFCAFALLRIATQSAEIVTVLDDIRLSLRKLSSRPAGRD
jgi:hypothetical protein